MNSVHAFLVALDSPDNETGRMDVRFFDPSYRYLIDRIQNLTKSGELKLAPLGELLSKSKTSVTGGATPKGAAYVPEGVKFVRVQNVREGRIEFDKAVLIPKIIHDRALKRSKLRPFDVLLTITGWTYGLAAVVPENVGEANINQHVARTEVNRECLDPYYLSCYLNSELGKGQMDRTVTGGTRPALDYSAIRSLNIVYPSDISKQADIGLKVQARYDEAYQCLKQRQVVLDGIEHEIESLLGITPPDETSFRSFVSEVSSSSRLDAISRSPYLMALQETICRHPHERLGNLVRVDTPKTPAFAAYYRLVDIRNIEERTGRVTQIIDVPTLGSGKILLSKGQILVSGLNPDKGKVIYVDDELDGCVGSLEFIPARLNADDVMLDYLLIILRSKLVTDQWKYQISGSTPSRERVDETTVLESPVPKPSAPIQKRIVDAVKSRIVQAIGLEQQHASAIKGARELFMNFLSDMET